MIDLPRRRRTGNPIRYGFLAGCAVVAALPAARPSSARPGDLHADPGVEIYAVRYGSIPGFPTSGLLPDAPEGETMDIAMAFWVIRSEDRVVLFDSGFFRDRWLERFTVTGFVRPDRALAPLGIAPDDVTDVVVSHAHWDHMGGVELFPGATIWIQRDEYVYYTATAWQAGGRTGGIDAEDVRHLVARNTEGLVRLVDGDGVEILPGLTVHTGARHTYASQYMVVDVPGGDGAQADRWVLASDNAHLYRALDERRASATFSPDDRAGNVAAGRRMIELAGSPERVVPGHDPEMFERFETVAEGVVRIH
jgi:glyoxylase-like metal-dependent hydrolase (beta-lactamase superfamily II)